MLKVWLKMLMNKNVRVSGISCLNTYLKVLNRNKMDSSSFKVITTADHKRMIMIFTHVLVIYCNHNNLPQTQRLNTTQIYYNRVQ